MLSSTSLLAMQQTDVDSVLLDGDVFQIKESELKKYLQSTYGTQVWDLTMTWSFQTVVPVYQRDKFDDSVFDSSYYYREIRFTLMQNDIGYRVSCTLKLSSQYDTIETKNYTSTPEAIVDNGGLRFLSSFSTKKEQGKKRIKSK